MNVAGSVTGGRAAAGIDSQSAEPIEVTPPVAPSTLRQRLVLADAATISLGILLAFGWQSLMRSGTDLGNQRVHLMLAFVTFPVWLVTFSLNKLYQSRGR